MALTMLIEIKHPGAPTRAAHAVAGIGSGLGALSRSGLAQSAVPKNAADKA